MPETNRFSGPVGVDALKGDADVGLHTLSGGPFWEIEAGGKHDGARPAWDGVHPVGAMGVEQHDAVDGEREAEEAGRAEGASRGLGGIGWHVVGDAEVMSMALQHPKSRL
jgi:hypothetical protein